MSGPKVTQLRILCDMAYGNTGYALNAAKSLKDSTFDRESMKEIRLAMQKVDALIEALTTLKSTVSALCEQSSSSLSSVPPPRPISSSARRNN